MIVHFTGGSLSLTECKAAHYLKSAPSSRAKACHCCQVTVFPWSQFRCSSVLSHLGSSTTEGDPVTAYTDGSASLQIQHLGSLTEWLFSCLKNNVWMTDNSNTSLFTGSQFSWGKSQDHCNLCISMFYFILPLNFWSLFIPNSYHEWSPVALKKDTNLNFTQIPETIRRRIKSNMNFQVVNTLLPHWDHFCWLPRWEFFSGEVTPSKLQAIWWTSETRKAKTENKKPYPKT